jgi:hypothetical protein
MVVLILMLLLTVKLYVHQFQPMVATKKQRPAQILSEQEAFLIQTQVKCLEWVEVAMDTLVANTLLL